MTKRKPIIHLKVLPGEPLDGSGRVYIHLFVRDEQGIITEPHVIRPVSQEEMEAGRNIEVGPARGRLACDPKRTVSPKTHNGVTTITPRSDDPRAVNCPKCMASVDYKSMMARIQPNSKESK
jgi:hypothetical protein